MDDSTLIERLAEAIAVIRAGGRTVGDLDRRRCRVDARRTLVALRSGTRL